MFDTDKAVNKYRDYLAEYEEYEDEDAHAESLEDFRLGYEQARNDVWLTVDSIDAMAKVVHESLRDRGLSTADDDWDSEYEIVQDHYRDAIEAALRNYLYGEKPGVKES
ncbi:hypothetical protein [Bifidobacterium xylocopae]|uniref:Uncharacterized protein n=1 Tax=Bifidobacterium xylocopae TaxID=2493119 RepID=A0A366KF81_9BIFI|nr:hypothetical protein [Bifidobacterium xylocopae]RBQ00048.1 hypothetical protein CRD59_00880 [Bifidobacterium xylocopae]